MPLDKKKCGACAHSKVGLLKNNDPLVRVQKTWQTYCDVGHKRVAIGTSPAISNASIEVFNPDCKYMFWRDAKPAGVIAVAAQPFGATQKKPGYADSSRLNDPSAWHQNTDASRKSVKDAEMDKIRSILPATKQISAR